MDRLAHGGSVEMVFLISGSDQKVHMFREVCDKADFIFLREFPVGHDAIILSECSFYLTGSLSSHLYRSRRYDRVFP